MGDLSSVKGCLAFTSELKEELWAEGVKIDHMVLSVGAWPHYTDPLSADGLNKVISLDLVARFLMLTELSPVLAEKARVMSVMASTNKMDARVTTEVMKPIITGERTSPSVLELIQ